MSFFRILSQVSESVSGFMYLLLDREKNAKY